MIEEYSSNSGNLHSSASFSWSVTSAGGESWKSLATLKPQNYKHNTEDASYKAIITG